MEEQVTCPCLLAIYNQACRSEIALIERSIFYPRNFPDFFDRFFSIDRSYGIDPRGPEIVFRFFIIYYLIQK